MKSRNEIWLADLNPQIGTETGKMRPVLIVQTDLLNHQGHNSTIIFPITTKIKHAEPIRIFLKAGTCGVSNDSEIMLDQIRAIDNSRFVKKIGDVSKDIELKINKFLRAVLELS
mgnify:CR=1 FL=1